MSLAVLAFGLALGSGPKIETVSAPAAFVSGGQVLTRVTTKGPAPVVSLNGTDVSARFQPTAKVGVYEGLVSGLALGPNALTATSGRGQASLTVTAHPLTGPMFSGPHQSPFICQTQDFKLPDGTTLGPAQDSDCSAPTVVQYVYRSTSGGDFRPLTDPTHLPADVAATTTRLGTRVAFVVRVETGTLNRGIYQFAVLHDPSQEAAPSPRTPSRGWDRRLIAVHGTGCARGWYVQGAALGANVLDVERLGEGYGLFSNTLNHPTNSCNPVLAGETATMVKQRVIETLGVPTFTLSMGTSGGAYTSLQLADAYPGLFDGVVISATFPDALAIASQASDGHLLTHYFRQTAPGSFSPAQQQAVGGYGSPGALLANANQAGRTDPVQGRADAPNYVSAPWNPAVPQALRYDPDTRTKGARPTVYDAAANIYGRDPETGFARRPFDNVGVQYGLKALHAGTISPAQFLDLNAQIGGYDQDANYVANRSRGDPEAISAAYRSGLSLSGHGGLAHLPILDTGGLYTDLEPAGEYHLRHHHFSVRERLIRANGRADNMVMWSGGLGLDARTRPESLTAGQKELLAAIPRESFRGLEAWLSAIAADDRPGSALARTLRNKPVQDGCWVAEGDRARFVAEPQIHQGDTVCNRVYPAFSFPRHVAGGPLAADVLKCALRPARGKDYPGFSPEDLARLKVIFPAGVCDFDRPGLGQVPVQPWAVW